MANKRLTLIDGEQITSSPSSKQKISSNYAIAIQIVWSGLTGTASFGVGVSMDDVNFDDFPLVDTSGNRVTAIPISGASGSATIEIESIISDWAKFTVDGSGASAGIVSAEYIQIDNQDTY
jgi:hypothetical protein